MPEEVTELDAYKDNITKRFFIDTADDNYIVAKWCYFHALNVDFSWLAVHCLEKYLKAALLLNGQSAISFRDSTGTLSKDSVSETRTQPHTIYFPDWFLLAKPFLKSAIILLTLSGANRDILCLFD